MKTIDVIRAADRAGLEHEPTCHALRVYTLPLLRQLARDASGWKFWLKWGMAALVAAVEGYVNLVCGDEG